MSTLVFNLGVLFIGLFGAAFLGVALFNLIKAQWEKKDRVESIASILGVIVGALITIGAYMVFSGEVELGLDTDATFFYNLAINMFKERIKPQGTPAEEQVMVGVLMLRLLKRKLRFFS